MSKEYKNPKAKDKYQVIIAENAEVLCDCEAGGTIAGESFFADSPEEAERILDEHTTVPGKGGVIIPPDSDVPSLTALPMRTKDDIIAAEGEFCDKVWYDRQQVHLENGSLKTAPKHIVRGAKAGALKMEAKYGKDNLGPYDDFEWGMINGKLSALRWVLGEEWDELDT